jgi:hypothetical protein
MTRVTKTSSPVARRTLPALGVGLLVSTVLAASGVAFAAELAPRQVRPALDAEESPVGVFSDRTLVLGIEIERDLATLLAYTVKPRPYVRSLAVDKPLGHGRAPTVQLEVVLWGPGDLRHTQRIDAGPLCLAHDGRGAPHVAGDTIRAHRDSVVVELPELRGFDHVEVAYYEDERGQLLRRSLGSARLDRARFTPAGGVADHASLAFADPDDDGAPAGPAAAQALWPEDFDDPELYHVYGDLAEGDRRINIVLVPDGYTYAEKAVLESHASSMVSHFRGKTPYAEHDPFINYILVYAYSAESGTDECDCGIVRNTMMGTRFPNQNPQCGHADNRCLYYGGGCDTNGTSNIIAAELRAPFRDATIVMVNTSRYGGCGGSRAVYSAALSSAVEIAVHELGHSLGGLADEYAYDPGCGVFAGEVNTSTNALQGAWPEWIADLGSPREGGQYYQQCIYRPIDECEMRSLNQPFCPVCIQHWSLVTFGHPRVAPTAPIEAQSPEAVTTAWVGIPADFSVSTRLSSGAHVSNLFTWTLTAPGPDPPLVIATGTDSISHVFDVAGAHTLEAEVIADANFIKRAKDGANVDVATWQIEVDVLLPPAEVSPPGSPQPLRFVRKATLSWEDASDAGAFGYNLYRGHLTDLESGAYGHCIRQGLPDHSVTDLSVPQPASGWFYLVAGVNPVGEGPLGHASSGAPRVAALPCE